MTTVYEHAVERVVGELREELVASLVVLINEAVGQKGFRKTVGEATRDIVELFHVECRELCAAGLDYEIARRFAHFLVPSERRRWLEDQLW